MAKASENKYAGLTLKQGRAIEMFLSGTTYSDIAAELDVSRDTVSRWVHLPASRAAISASVRSAIQRTTAQLANGADLALNTLRELMVVGKADSVRLGAAQSWLNMAMKAWELGMMYESMGQMQDRLAALEQEIQDASPERPITSVRGKIEEDGGEGDADVF